MSNQITQNFQAALDYEKSCWSRADLFYKNRYGDRPGMRIWRPDWDTFKSIQKADIDVVVRSQRKDGWTDELKISEKFRTQPWLDVCIEIYEDFDKRRPGWGSETAAEWHFFFHEHKWTTSKRVDDGTGKKVTVEEEHDQSFVRMVPTWAIRKMCAFCKDIFTETFQDMRENKVGQKETFIGDDDIKLLLIPTKVNGKTAYVGACACVPKHLFKTMFDCDIEEQLY